MKKTVKRCYRCARELPASAFTRNVTKYDGHADECKQCRADYDKRRIQRYRERNLALRASA